MVLGKTRIGCRLSAFDKYMSLPWEWFISPEIRLWDKKLELKDRIPVLLLLDEKILNFFSCFHLQNEYNEI